MFPASSISLEPLIPARRRHGGPLLYQQLAVYPIERLGHGHILTLSPLCTSRGDHAPTCGLLAHNILVIDTSEAP